MYEVYWDNTLVGFNSILNMPSGTLKYAYREHRLVVLPDFQGLGFGTKISEFIGEHLINGGNKFFSRTTHVRLGTHRTNSDLWVGTSTNQLLRKNINEVNNGTSQGSKYKRLDGSRVAYSFEYVGENYNKDHQVIACFGECDYDVAITLLDSLIDKNKYTVISCGIASTSKISVWERIAKERGIRTEVLLLSRRGDTVLNTSLLNNFDSIITDVDGFELLEPVKKNINKCVVHTKLKKYTWAKRKG